MFPSLMLIVLSQCSGGACVNPATFGGFSLPAPVVVRQPAPRVVPKLQRIEITHEGLDLTVEGIQLPNRKVNWNPDSPFNAAALAVARERERVASLTPKPKATPSPPAKPSVTARPADPFPGGVVPSRIKGPTYHASGEKAREYVAAIAKPEPANGKLHLTVIGTADERAQVLGDIKTDPAFTPLRDNLLIQDYAPEEWPVDPSLGFQKGNPTILLQAGKGPDDPKGGRVLYRAADYSMGPEGLAEEVRKADPNYKPESDPGPENKDKKKPKPDSPSACPVGFDKGHTPYVAGTAFLIVVIFLVPRKEG